MFKKVVFILLFSSILIPLCYYSYSFATTEEDIVKKYFDLLREFNNLYQDIKQEKAEKSKETEQLAEKGKDKETEQVKQEKTLETTAKKEETEETTAKKEETEQGQKKQEEPQKKQEELQGLYTRKYNIEFVKDFIEKDLKKLLQDEQAQAVFFEDGTVEVTDVDVGHKRVSEYISHLKSKYLKVYNYEIYIDGQMKYSGTVSPVLPANFSREGVITCLPKDEFLLVNISDYFGRLQAKFMIPSSGGQYEFLNDKEHVKIVLKEIVVTTSNK